MSTINKLNYKIKELQSYAVRANLCVQNINTSKYLLSVEFCEKQIDMFSDDVSEASPTLCFIFGDELKIITSDNFKTNETVFNKLKNLSKEINHLYLQAFREEVGDYLDSIKDMLPLPLSIQRFFDNFMCDTDTDTEKETAQ